MTMMCHTYRLGPWMNSGDTLGIGSRLTLLNTHHAIPNLHALRQTYYMGKRRGHKINWEAGW